MSIPPPTRTVESPQSRFKILAHLPRQLAGRTPFEGDIQPSRIPLFASGTARPTLPFPHPWNYQEPIRILESYFWNADQETGGGRHNRYLEVPGFAPILVTRDPGVIRAVTTETGDREGQFDRDTLPSEGIARATGADSLLYSNGGLWRHQRKLAASPFGKTTLFQPEKFHEFAETFRKTVTQRVALLREKLAASDSNSMTISLEPEIKVVMLEMLVNNFFGAEISYERLRNDFVPALERVIDNIVRDTVANPLGIPTRWIPALTARTRRSRQDALLFEELTDLVLSGRKTGRGLWQQFRADSPDAALRSNLKVFLAGALEATTSFAGWAISHLARNPSAQNKVFEEVRDLEDYAPENLETGNYLAYTLEETLRLTPSLYFLPRRATVDTWIKTADGRKLKVPAGTHLLLDVWHANRHDDHWGVAISGYPALDFAPERWPEMASRGRASKETLHFGFGHGPRVCPGKHLGQLEVGLVVGAFVKVFRFSSPNLENPARAGVSTKPQDGVLINLQLRDP